MRLKSNASTGISSVATGTVYTHSAPVDGDGVKKTLLLNHKFLFASPHPFPSRRLKRYLEAVEAGDEAVKEYHRRHGR